MSDKKQGKSGPVLLTKGYTPAKTPTSVQDGYRPSTGKLGSPPTTGSVISKPPMSKKP